MRLVTISEARSADQDGIERLDVGGVAHDDAAAGLGWAGGGWSWHAGGCRRPTGWSTAAVELSGVPCAFEGWP